MNSNKSTVVFGSLLLASAATPLGGARVQPSPPPQNRTPVVVELFTSEGCSTCPPADNLLVKLEQQQFVEGAEVIAVEEHVDYWNHDGWTDPFSSLHWTLRQREYAATFKIDGVYTPQMVVDGREQFVGSRMNEVTGSIRRNAQQHRAKVVISEIATSAKQTRQFQVTVTDLVDPPDGDSCDVWLLITEKGLRSLVNAGENAGRNLQHASVLRWMHKIGQVNGRQTLFSGESTVKLKPSWNLQNLRAVTFVQAHRSKQILGAASLAFSR